MTLSPTGRLALALAALLAAAASPALADDPEWGPTPTAPRRHVVHAMPHVRHAAYAGYAGRPHRCPLGSEGGNTAWLVRGMPLNNFHTNASGQIVGGAPTRCHD